MRKECEEDEVPERPFVFPGEHAGECEWGKGLREVCVDEEGRRATDGTGS